MKDRDLNNVLYAGRSFIEYSCVFQIAIVTLAVCVDSILFYQALESIITEKWILNLIVTISAVCVADGTPLILSKLVYKRMNKQVKTFTCIVLSIVLCLVFAFFFLIRWSSRASLMGASLGLLDNSSAAFAMNAVDNVAILMGILPILSSCVVFASGILAYDPGKRKRQLVLSYYRSKNRENQYKRTLSEYGTEDDRITKLEEYNESMRAWKNGLLDATEKELEATVDRLLAQQVNT